MKIKKIALNCISILLILLTIINSNSSVFAIMAKDEIVISTKQTITVDNNKQATQYHYRNQEVDVTVTLKNTTDLPENAVLKVTAVDMDENMIKAVHEDIAEKKVKVENKVAYDISFLVNGKDVEPLNSVDVNVNLLKNEAKATTTASVYHYDEKEKLVDDMKATLTSDKVVEFSTTHFSTYIIVNTSNSNANISIEHYNEDYTYKETTDDVYPANAVNSYGKSIGGTLIGGKSTTVTKTVLSDEIYSTDHIALQSGSRITNYAKAVNWEVSRVIQYTEDEQGNVIESEVSDINKIYVTEDSKFRIYYNPVASTKEGEVKFFDYTVSPSDKQIAGINADSNYKQYGTSTQNKNRFGMGVNPGINGISAITSYKINEYTGELMTDQNGNVTRGGAAKGIITGLTADYTDVVFGKNKEGIVIDDANILNDKPVSGKEIYSNFKLSFTKLGDRYTLDSVKNSNQETVAKAGTNFFPLDNVKQGVVASDLRNTVATFGSNIKHNDYYAMRYDVKFTIGDYLGPLNYSFSGDDDLWVILDGKEVVIDLGGIHNNLTESVDLWKFIKDASGNYDKNIEHTLTIIYMERGAYDSDCRMNFTLPNATIAEVIDQPKANLDIKKVNSKGEPLSNAVFQLTNNQSGNVITAKSNDQGDITFNNLTVGTYTLMENSAPSGYTISNDKWVIKVVETTDKKAIASLYKADGVTKIDNNTIINFTSTEIIDKTISYNKTATVRNWDSRTYDINLEADTKDITTITPVPYDIVMVLDRSSSMDTSFVQYQEFMGSEFESGSQYFYKTQYGLYQLLDVDVSRSKTSALFTDTEGGNKKVEVKLGENTIYERANYEKFDGDEFEGVYYGDYFVPSKIYYYKQDDGKYSFVRVESETKGQVDINNVRVNIDLSNQNTKSRIYIDTDSMSKKNALAKAADEFIDSVAKLSPNSRISIVDYSSGDKILVHKTNDGKNMIRVGSSGNLESLKSWITEPGGTGFTRSDLGLAAAYNIFKDESTWEAVEENPSEERKNMVVFFTDGITTDDSGAYSPANAKKAVDVANNMRSDFQATIYAIGIFDTANKTGSLQTNADDKVTNVTVKSVNDTMLGIASPNSYLTADSASSLNDIFIKISTDVVQSIKADTITDVIDNRFELTSESEGLLKASGAEITKNANGTTTVTWKNQSIKRKVDSRPGWFRTLTVIAKDDYIGGNNITTNGSNSYIEINNVIAPFPMPVVNVKTNLAIGDLDKTIFLGEGIPGDASIFKNIESIINTNVTKYKVSKDAFKLSWTDAAGNAQTKNWSDIKPNSDVNYTATLTYVAGTPTEESNKNTTKNGTIYYSGDIKNSYKNTLKGTYRIHVVKGQIEIKKVIDQQYTNIKQINANQTFVFKIERYDVDDNNKKIGEKPIEIYYETINFDANDTVDNKSKIISGLKKGYYTVTEESSWSSKYKLLSKVDNYTKNNTEGIDLFIGDCLENETSTSNVVYYGLEQDNAYLKYAMGDRGEIVFNNQFDKNWNWLSDTSAAVNVFNK